jgi:enoyl-[acyl-carrier protein] reductase I
MRAIDLSHQNALVTGVANHRSLAWAIAEALAAAGCRLAFSYQGERLKESVTSLAAKLEGSLVLPCDVTKDDEMDALFQRLGDHWGKLHVLIHSIAFARREDLEGEFRATSREGWNTALEVSAYSFVALSHRAARLMQEGGSIVTLTYQASQRVFPNYNVMGSAKAALEHATRQLAFELGGHGIRVNAVSAGPVSTLSARGVSGFTGMLQTNRERAPLRRNVEGREVADAALFLCSPLASGVTGHVLYVDAGYHIMGV